MHKNSFLKAIMAGLMIGFAGIIYLSLENRIIGALFFSFGLLMVVSKGYFLYTGKVGYALPYEKGYLKILVQTLIGNVIGIMSLGLLFRFTGLSDIILKSEVIFLGKLDKSWYETLILAVFCGMMMYIAVENYKKLEIPLLRVLIVIMPVAIFILASFEHSVANMLYMSMSLTFTLKAMIYLILWITGNAIGAVTLNLIEVKLVEQQAK
ncbi:MAG: formate/nitrite transporter [Tenericutes bacterium HGW-Tenericutes-6]|nr:MAG: formate/nitrite transporter [Tenericutes bacterium HGW-Tenericutes-6]